MSTESFEEFVHATADRMLRTAMLLCGGDRHRADDLVQTAYETAYSRWRLVSRADNPMAYTRTILTRAFLSDRRRRRVTELPLHDGADVAAPTRDPTTRLSVIEALATVPPLDRAVLVLRYFVDLTVAETAAQLGITESACRTRSSRALARLRHQLPDLDPEQDPS